MVPAGTTWVKIGVACWASATCTQLEPPTGITLTTKVGARTVAVAPAAEDEVTAKTGGPAGWVVPAVAAVVAVAAMALWGRWSAAQPLRAVVVDHQAGHTEDHAAAPTTPTNSLRQHRAGAWRRSAWPASGTAGGHPGVGEETGGPGRRPVLEAMGACRARCRWPQLGVGVGTPVAAASALGTAGTAPVSPSVMAAAPAVGGPVVGERAWHHAGQDGGGAVTMAVGRPEVDQGQGVAVAGQPQEVGVAPKGCRMPTLSGSRS